ncbi:MAG: MBL fold metallo-hydrolase [Planctomycetota bacterium]
MEITFLGAVRTVTGSMHLIAHNGKHILLECGIFQGSREDAYRRNRHFPFDPATIDAVVLSHAHLDHCGNLPTLFVKGFRGRVYATPATRDLATVILLDSAHIQEHDVIFVNKRRQRQGLPPFNPLYVEADALRAIKAITSVPYHVPFEVEGLTVEFFDAGHILGSALVAVSHTENGIRRTLAFSGDIGRKEIPILRDPEPPPAADACLMESTYGVRIHDRQEKAEARLAEVISATAARGGKIIIPAFAVERTQELAYRLSRLLRKKLIPEIPTYVDSPMAVNATEVFRSHPECFDPETYKAMMSGKDPFGMRIIHYVKDSEESKAINDLAGPAIIIASSGMCTSGRILHHLRHNIGNPANTILIVGFQAEGTLGKRLVEKADIVKIFGEEHRRLADVVVMTSLSSHADQEELVRWHRRFQPKPAQTFLVHGNEDACLALQAKLVEAKRGNIVVPREGEKYAI